jgi:hypothetical protein
MTIYLQVHLFMTIKYIIFQTKHVTQSSHTTKINVKGQTTHIQLNKTEIKTSSKKTTYHP